MKTLVLLLSLTLLWTGYGNADEALMDPAIDKIVVETRENPEARQALEDECINVIGAAPEWPALHRAIRLLALIGSERSVEPLASLLDDPATAHFARYALEPMPFEAVNVALREALDKATGETQRGIIASLAVRQDKQSIPALANLLHDDDVGVAMTAATALGHMGDIEMLLSQLEEADEPLKQAIAKALLAAAGHSPEENTEVYAQLLNTDFPTYIRAGAFVGLLSRETEPATDLALATIRGDDDDLRMVAIAAAATIPGEAAAQRFAEELPALPDTLKPLMIEALAERDEPVAVSVMHDALGSANDAVRLAAMKAVADHGNAASIEPVCALIERTENRQEKMAAVETLRRLRGPDVDDILISHLNEAPVAVRAELMEALVQRGATSALDAIIAQVGEPEVRGAAFRALGQIATPEHLPLLLQLLTTIEEDTGRTEAEGAIATLCRRIARERGKIVIEKAVYGDLPDGPVADVTQRVQRLVKDGPLAFQVDNSILGDPAPDIAKRLHVTYTVNGVSGSQTVAEGDTLTVPDDVIPQDVLETLARTLEQEADTKTKVSLLRIIGHLGGTTAFDILLAHKDSDDAAVHDAAVRGLANWPEPHATTVLAEIFTTTENTTHRTLALRGCVRLLRLEQMPSDETLAMYARLTEVSNTPEEHKMIIAGLADVAHPDALLAVAPFLDDDAVRQEAAMAIHRIQEALGEDAPPVPPRPDMGPVAEGFERLFDGRTLTDWTGDPKFWRVEGGVIVGETTEETPAEVNTFLIWDGGEVDDFELTLRYRIETESANSGIQIRSERFDDYRVRGYQPDIATEDWITGICFEEGGRGILARRGERVTFTPDGEKEVVRFAEEDILGRRINMDDWNTYRIIARDNYFVSSINGHVMHEIVDDAPEARRSGIIAFQLHTGPPMKILFTDIELKRIK